MTKRRLKIRPVLITLNVALLIIITLFYTTRLIKYYLKENGHRPTNSTVLLVDELIKKQSYVDLTKGLIHDKDANIFRYVGKVEDNYLEYSGILFRIVGIDKDSTGLDCKAFKMYSFNPLSFVPSPIKANKIFEAESSFGEKLERRFFKEPLK